MALWVEHLSYVEEVEGLKVLKAYFSLAHCLYYN